MSRQCCKAAISTGIVEVACPQVVELHYISAAMSMTDMYAMAADHDNETRSHCRTLNTQDTLLDEPGDMTCLSGSTAQDVRKTPVALKQRIIF